MSSILINISSDNRTQSENTDNFTVPFSPSIPISGNWVIALQSAGIWYSWYNISEDYSNTIFRYYNGSVWKNINITSGLYSLDDINIFIQAAMKANGDYTAGSPDTYFITLTPNYNTFKCAITISGGYQIDFTVGLLNELLGFTPIIVTTSQEGLNNVNITNGIDKVLIHLDCVVGSYTGSSSSDVLFGFSPNTSPSSLIQLEPNNLVFLPLSKSGYLNNIRVYITDQRNRRLNLNGETVTLALVLKRII
jgi:hypothetical protein